MRNKNLDECQYCNERVIGLKHKFRVIMWSDAVKCPNCKAKLRINDTYRVINCILNIAFVVLLLLNSNPYFYNISLKFISYIQFRIVISLIFMNFITLVHEPDREHPEKLLIKKVVSKNGEEFKIEIFRSFFNDDNYNVVIKFDKSIAEFSVPISEYTIHIETIITPFFNTDYISVYKCFNKIIYTYKNQVFVSQNTENNIREIMLLR